MRESVYNIWVKYGSNHYVYNSISGSLLRLSSRDYWSVRAFLDGELSRSNASPLLLEQLVCARMLIADDVDEIKFLRHRYEVSQADKKTLGLTLVVSLQCNFDCLYCFERKYSSTMNDDIEAAVLRFVKAQAPKIDQLTITWYGGEPLVGKAALLRLSRSFIEQCEQYKIRYSASIITNGYLLNEETCQQLRDARIEFAQVTLDGPPIVHDRMRPLACGQGTFSQIVKNLHHAIHYFRVGVRVNLDSENTTEANGLLEILAAEGFSGKLTIHCGQIIPVDDGQSAPSVTYSPACFTNADFARVELEFNKIAQQYGFEAIPLPRLSGAPCTAVRANGLVIGSEGELYKCWESVGNPAEVIGHIADVRDANVGTSKWLKFDPFESVECRQCIALPICMGGCAHHAMDKIQYGNRCRTFRHTFHEQVLAFVERIDNVAQLARISHAK